MRGPRAPLHLPQTAGPLSWFRAHAGNRRAAVALTGDGARTGTTSAGRRCGGRGPDAWPGTRGRGYRSWHESTLLSRQPRQDHERRQLPASLVIKGQSYTGTGRATCVRVACPARPVEVSVSWPMRDGLADGEVQRSVHAQVSRQYQRRSWQARPPSATIWSADKRMPHIQHDLTGAGSAQAGPGRPWSVMASSPGKFPARGAVLVRGAGTFTGAAGASSEGCHRAAPRSASCSSGRSPISDVPSSYGQPVSMCKPSRPLTGTWSTPCVRPPPRSPSPITGDGLTLPLAFQVSRSRSLHNNQINFR
jgi:hypothetical protein